MLSRRAFLAGTAAAAALAACGDGAAGDPPLTTTAKAKSGQRVLGAGFADGLASPSVLVPGLPQRLPFVVFDADNGQPVRDGGPDSIEVSIVQGTTIVATATVPRHATRIPTPYYPFTFTPPAPGDYEARAAFSARPLPFKVGTRDTVKLVQVGEAMRPVLTPVTTNARGVDPICTRSPAPCPFHAISLTDALAAKQPTVFIVSTPGFCQTQVCGPVLEHLVDLAPSLGSLQIVHAEVYVEPNKKTNGSPKTTDAVATYQLSYEPSLFVADAAGIVRARLDFTWDATELDAALALVRSSR